MKRLIPASLLAGVLCSTTPAASILSEGFEGRFPPTGWTENSVDLSSTYAANGTYSAKFSATGDDLITPPLTNAHVLTCWTYTTSANPNMIVEISTTPTGPWTAVPGSPFSGPAEQWNEQPIPLATSGTLYVKIRKSGSGTLYIDDASAEGGDAYPEFIGLENIVIWQGDDVTLTITATNTTSLSATSLPADATFHATTNTGSITGTLNWVSPSAGTYSATFEAAGFAGTNTETIQMTVSSSSQIDGYFYGWKNKRVFALKNGQFWQQIVTKNSDDALLKPTATITNYLKTGTYRLYVENAGPPAYVEVRQLTNVVRTAIDGTFYGFAKGTFFHLQNGDWWRQTSLDTSSSTRSNPDILIWNDNGTDTIQMPDEGRTVDAEQLTILGESRVTNNVNGLHYGSTYQLADGTDWLQISFENISSSASNPDAMLWVDGNDTHLLIRSGNDEEIGNCEVINPGADDDGDQVANADEIIAGTDRTDANAFFEITETQVNGRGHYTVNWAAVDGRRYTILWAASLDETFQPQGTVDAPTNSWTDTDHTTDAEGFYRIDVQLIP